MHSRPLELKLLGAPEAAWNGAPLALPRRQARALLFRLGTELQPVTRDALLLLLWPDTADSTARRNLTRLLSYLRGALPDPNILQTTSTAVLLNQDLVASDAVDFAKHLAVNDEPAWEAAVGLVRGQFLGGFSLPGSHEFDGWLSTTGQQIERQYLAALSKLVTAKTAAADYPAAIHYARQYLGTDDLAEEIHRQLITLYAATGQRSAALRQFEECMLVLERELGVEPLPETRAAYEAARDGIPLQPSPSTPQVEWTTLPGLDLPLIGRQAAWEELAGAYDRFRGGGAILIAGEAGVGKSRLMQEFATAQGGLVLAGNSHAGSQTLPYQPLVQALRQALPLHERWHHTAPIWLAEASRLLPELASRFPGLPQPVEMEAQEAQARLFEALSQLFRSLSADTPILLCLDDVHWADEATRGWLQYLTTRLGGSELCILATCRVHKCAELQDWERALKRDELETVVKLEGLDERAIGDLLRQAGNGMAVPELLASRIHAATGGNAFFVLETVRELLETGQLADPPADLPLPPTIRDAVLRRASRLTPLAQQILEMASVLSPLLTFAVICEAAGRDELRTADSLEELVARQLLRADDAHFRFQHELTREAIYQNISAWRRRLLHRRSGNILGELYASKPEAIAAQRAKHYDAAGAYEQAVEFYEMAAQAAQAIYAHEEAIRYLQRAINLLPEIEAASGQHARLYEVLGRNLEDVGRFEAAREAFHQAIGFQSPGNNTSLAQLYHFLGRTQLAQLFHKEAEILLERALTTLGEPPTQDDEGWWQIWLDIQMDRLILFNYLSDLEQCDTLTQEMIPIVERTDSLETKIEFNKWLMHLSLTKERYRPSPETTLTLTRDSLELARTTQNPWTITFLRFSVGYILLHSGELDAAESHFLDSLTLAREIDHRVHEARVLAFLSTSYRRMKDKQRTAEYAQLAGEKGAAVGNRHYVAHSLANFAWLAYRNGQTTIALEKSRKASQRFLDANTPFSWIAFMILLAIHLDKGELDRAVEATVAMLDPKQQRLQDDVEHALTTAVSAWEANDVDGTRTALETAVALATHHGYL